MPFKSKAQQRLFFSGALPGVDKKKALEWAHETPSMKKLPEHKKHEKKAAFDPLDDVFRGAFLDEIADTGVFKMAGISAYSGEPKVSATPQLGTGCGPKHGHGCGCGACGSHQPAAVHQEQVEHGHGDGLKSGKKPDLSLLQRVAAKIHQMFRGSQTPIGGAAEAVAGRVKEAAPKKRDEVTFSLAESEQADRDWRKQLGIQPFQRQTSRGVYEGRNPRGENEMTFTMDDPATRRMSQRAPRMAARPAQRPGGLTAAQTGAGYDPFAKGRVARVPDVNPTEATAGIGPKPEPRPTPPRFARIARFADAMKAYGNKPFMSAGNIDLSHLSSGKPQAQKGPGAMMASASKPGQAYLDTHPDALE